MKVRVFAAAFFCLASSMVLVAGTVSAPPPPATAPTGGISTTQNTVAMITSLSNELQAQTEVVKSIREQLRMLLAQRPQHPGEGASDDALKAYQRSLAEWNSRVDALRAQLDAAIAKLDDVRKRLDAAVEKLPVANAEDVQRVRKAAAEARAAAEKTLAEANRQRGGAVKPPSRTTTSPAPKPAPAPVPAPAPPT